MELITLKKILLSVHDQSNSMDFPQWLRACRTALHTKKYFVAEQLGISEFAYNHLESGNFKTLPSIEVFHGLSLLYGMKISEIYEKAVQYVEKRKKINKIRIKFVEEEEKNEKMSAL